MHFYTYDEWLSKDYYWVDAKELNIGNTKSYHLDLSLNRPTLIVRSMWQNSKFISTYDEGPTSINPVSPDIDCDLGCLFEFDESAIPSSFSHDLSGCIQILGHPRGQGSYDSYPYIQMGSDNQGYNSYSESKFEEFAVNLGYRDYFKRILVFQSIYSGAVTYDSMNAKLNFYQVDYSAPTDADPLCIVNTHLPGGNSLMIIGALIEFENDYINITNISKFVQGHVDMDMKYNWNLLWSTFVPPDSSKILLSSIMHRTKT